MKKCTRCKKQYPATTEHFSPDKRYKSGLQSWCRACKRKCNRRYQQSNKGKKMRLKYLNTIKGHLRQVYGAMKNRCNNQTNNRYKRYGGRGIKCRFTSDEFVDYVVNVLKVNPMGLQIDRINNDGHYEVGNIRFVTCKENNNNKSRV